MEDLKASRHAKVIQDSGIMFQVMAVRGKNEADKHLSRFELE